jgi:hypothetical protein
LYWARTDRGLRYSVCTQICMLNTWNAITYICTEKVLWMQTLIDNRQTLPIVREGALQRHNSNR